jgi:hypothetical protein
VDGCESLSFCFGVSLILLSGEVGWSDSANVSHDYAAALGTHPQTHRPTNAVAHD